MAKREVALILNINKPYDRKVVAGIARFTHTKPNWELYVEDDPLDKIPDLRTWHGHGIIADLDDQQVFEAIANSNIPVVNIGGAIFDKEWKSDAPYITTDNEAVARMAAEHLLDQGFTNFAYCGFKRTPYNPWSLIRGEAFSKAVQERGFECDIFRGRYANVRQWESVQKGLCTWLSSLETPLGLFACNDARARHILESCRRLGLRVPHDVAILGADNDEMMCELTNPTMSSISLGTDQIGYEAARLLDDLISRRRISKDRRFVQVEPLGVVMRTSTKIVAVPDPDVAKAIEFIREHVGKGIRVSDVTQLVDLSRSTLDNRFKEVLNRTVHDEIERVRLELTKELLLKTDWTLSEISRRTGFASVQYMATVFRRATGVPPGQFRQEHQRELNNNLLGFEQGLT